MSNPDLLNQADRILRPVLIKLVDVPWLNVTGCCAGHQPEDSVWFEADVRGTSGLERLMEWLRVLEGKLDGTNCRTDCLINYSTPVDPDAEPEEFVDEFDDALNAPHGWIPVTLETFWPVEDDWRHGQALIIEALLSSMEELGRRLMTEHEPDGAINYCPFCSSSFVRLEGLDSPGHRYKCGDCEMAWTMIDPKL
jgi:hypothetical protein